MIELLVWFWIWDYRFFAFLGEQTSCKMLFLQSISVLISLTLFLFIVIHASTIDIVDNSNSNECAQVKYLGSLITAFMILLGLSYILQAKAVMNAIFNPLWNPCSKDKNTYNFRMNIVCSAFGLAHLFVILALIVLSFMFTQSYNSLSKEWRVLLLEGQVG